MERSLFVVFLLSGTFTWSRRGEGPAWRGAGVAWGRHGAGQARHEEPRLDTRVLDGFCCYNASVFSSLFSLGLIFLGDAGVGF